MEVPSSIRASTAARAIAGYSRCSENTGHGVGAVSVFTITPSHHRLKRRSDSDQRMFKMTSHSTRPILKIKRLRENTKAPIKIPKYATTGSSGLDLHADIGTALAQWFRPGQKFLIPTGLAVEIPEGYEGQIRSRSGLALKLGLVVLNSPGTIDSDYRGEIGVILMNTSDDDVSIDNGERIAQLVIAPVVQPIIEEAAHLSETKRGEGGFGSTGSK